MLVARPRIAHHTHDSKQKTKATVSLGRALRAMERVAEAWSAGEISREHVAALAKARRGADEAFDRDVKALLEDAKESPYYSWWRRLDYWVLDNDPERAERNFEEEHDGRKCHVSKLFETTVGDFTLDRIGGAIFRRELKRLTDEAFAVDWAEAKERLGRDPFTWELARTHAQRRADALVEMATRSRMAPANGRRPEPLFSVFIGYERLCELADGSVIPPSALIPWLDRAWIERIVFGSPSRVIDV